MNISLILIPVDFTDCSENAIYYAKFLKQMWNAELILIHVVDAKITEKIAAFVKEPLSKVRDRLVNQAIQAFRKFLKTCDAQELVKDTIVSYGQPFQEIAIKARELKADLILMGGYGSGGKGKIDEIFFGSTVEKVVRLLPCPVLCVPMGWPPEEY